MRQFQSALRFRWISRVFGNYTRGQAEYLIVPFGNYTPFIIPKDCELEDEQLLFLSDVLPTAYWSVEHAGVKKGDTVIVLGCGPVGLMAQQFAWKKGAERVIASTTLITGSLMPKTQTKQKYLILHNTTIWVKP